MLLAVDIGNSRTKFGLFDGETLLTNFSIPTLKNAARDDIRLSVAGNIAHPITRAIICSVVPEIDAEFSEFISDEFGVRGVFVTNELDLGLKINYQPRSAAGTDRLVNAFAAAEKYGVPCIVCSFGPAVTIDFVNEKSELVGGLIAPGMQTMAKALHLNASRLPEVTIDRPDSVLQISTEGS
ncbi:MAG: type III pantothenate kinase, partial [Pyrinomonadaceae bacterium]